MDGPRCVLCFDGRGVHDCPGGVVNESLMLYDPLDRLGVAMEIVTPGLVDAASYPFNESVIALEADGDEDVIRERFYSHIGDA